MTPRPVSPAVSQEIALHCHDRRGRPMAFVAGFGYDPADPYAVWITFHTPGGDVRWVVERTLLRAGLTEPAGEGDIQVFPSIDEKGRAVVCIDFHSPDGRLLTEVVTTDLQPFLDRVFAAVPVGEESQLIDLDQLVTALLA